jgi:hypothetical protein
LAAVIPSSARVAASEAGTAARYRPTPGCYRVVGQSNDPLLRSILPQALAEISQPRNRDVSDLRQTRLALVRQLLTATELSKNQDQPWRWLQRSLSPIRLAPDAAYGPQGPSKEVVSRFL